MHRIRVIIADDHAMLREGIRHLLDREHDLRIVDEAEDAAQVERLVARLQPDVLCVDQSLLAGVQTLRRIREKSPKTQILILTEGPSESDLLGYIKAGARGAISKRETGGVLVKALRTVAAGEVWAGRRVMARVIEELSTLATSVEGSHGVVLPPLTQREVRITELVAQGCNNKEIAEKLRLSEKTIKNHLTNIYEKLGCRDRAQLMAFLLR